MSDTQPDEQRGRYDAKEIAELGAEGKAFKNPDGHFSYPIADEADLRDAVKAVGRGGADHDAIRKYIIGRAKALKLESMVPSSWNADGSITEANSQEAVAETTVEGEHVAEREADDPALERRRMVAASLEDTPEQRVFSADLEVRDTSDGGLRFTGYASTTETPYEVSDFTETIARGAFKRTLSNEPDVVFLVNHAGIPMARTKSGTLTLSEDARGLRVDADLDPTDPNVQAILPAMKRGDLTEMSFAFRATDQDWDERYENRTIKEVSIHRGDVSMVTMGANPTTTGEVAFRSEDGLLEVRVGKALSGQKEEDVKAAIAHLESLLPADEPEPEAAPADVEVTGATLIPRSSVAAERARRARTIARAS